jgi:GINS complex subunit 4
MNRLQRRSQAYSDFTTQNYSSFMTTLITIWRNEKLSQTLLPYEENIINEVISQIEKKEEEIKNKKMDKNMKYYIEIDIQHIKYIIKDYFRIRLMKIEKYLFFLLKNNKIDILSQNEIKFAAELMDIKAAYFIQGLKKMNSLANNFFQFTDKTKTRVEKMQTINDAMITKPDENDYVVVQNVSNNTLNINIKDIYGDYQGDFLSIYSGEKCFVPFKLIENYLKHKQVKII